MYAIRSYYAPRKALELLEALIALGGRDVHLTHLMCSVWTESESRDQRKLFDNTLHRLRKVLGHDEAILLSNAKLTLNHEVCWVDAWAFQRLAGRALALDAPDSEVATRAVALYQGHFLQGELELPWLISYRDRLHSTFLRLVMKHGERLEADRITSYNVCYTKLLRPCCSQGFSPLGRCCWPPTSFASWPMACCPAWIFV